MQPIITRKIHVLGTPDTRRRGRRTRKALRALTSNPPCPLRRAPSIKLIFSMMTVKTLGQEWGGEKQEKGERQMVGAVSAPSGK